MDTGSIVAIAVAVIGIGPSVGAYRQITKDRKARNAQGSLEDRAQTLTELQVYTQGLLQELEAARDDREECERKREELERRFDTHREASRQQLDDARGRIQTLEYQVYNLQNPTPNIGLPPTD